MRAYLIDPFDRTVKPVDYQGDIKEIYSLIQADCFDCCRFSTGNLDGVYVDDEGLLKPDQEFFMIGNYPSPLAGRGLVIGCDEVGESIGAQSSIDDMHVRFGRLVRVSPERIQFLIEQVVEEGTIIES